MVTYLRKTYIYENITIMEQLNQITDNPQSVSENEQKEFITTRTVTVKPLKDWAFIEAGLNQGDNTAFENKLRLIKAGHIVDSSHDAEDEHRRKKHIETEIQAKEVSKISKEKDLQHIKDVIIADKEIQAKQQKDNIELKKIQMAEGRIKSLYSPARFWLYTILTTVIAIYLIFFYASAINASFFRNIQQMVNNSSSDDVALMMNSIFDTKGIFQPDMHLLFVYLGAFLFFGFGILPHTFQDSGKWKWVKVMCAIVACLTIDCLIAYKIDSGIHELKQMMGVADEGWIWFKSVNFYLVLSFGFGTYLLWGFMYEAAHTEHDKKNVNAKAEIEIKGMKKRIREIENEIIGQKKEINELQKIIEELKLAIEKLKKDLEEALMKPETLLRNMENFYAGWLQYLNNTTGNEGKIQTCETIYKNFHQFPLPSLTNLN